MQITFVAAIAMMACGTALAQERQRQRPGGGPGFGGGTMFLLGQESIQKELKLSDEQVKKVKELAEKQGGGRPDFQGLSREEIMKKMAERRKVQDEAVAKILDAKQLKRVKQLQLQQQGVRALSNAEVAKALKLTDEQKDKIKDIQTKAREAAGGPRGDRSPEAQKKREEARKATTEKVMGVLTAEQKTALKELQGEPFKFEPRTGAGGGRGRPNRPNRPTPPADKNG
jgi:Spy/CpxP family protein refolding chaperone